MVTYSRLGGTSSSPALQGCPHADIRVDGIGEALSLPTACLQAWLLGASAVSAVPCVGGRTAEHALGFVGLSHTGS